MTKQTQSTSTSKTHSSEDPFLYYTDQLNAIADEETIRYGLDWFKKNRVHSLTKEGESLLGIVEDAETEDDVSCRLSYSPDGELVVGCYCNEAFPRFVPML